MQSFNPRKIIVNSTEHQARFIHWGSLFGLVWVNRLTQEMDVVELFDDELEYRQHTPQVAGWNDDAVQIAEPFHFTLAPSALLSNINAHQLTQQLGFSNQAFPKVHSLSEEGISVIHETSGLRGEEVIPMTIFWMKAFFQHLQLNEEPVVWMILRNKSFQLWVGKDQKLLLANTFSFHGSTDVLYHVLNVFQSLGINNQEAQIHALGEITEDAEVWKLLQRYVQRILPFGGLRLQAPHFFPDASVQSMAALNVMTS